MIGITVRRQSFFSGRASIADFCRSLQHDTLCSCAKIPTLFAVPEGRNSPTVKRETGAYPAVRCYACAAPATVRKCGRITKPLRTNSLGRRCVKTSEPGDRPRTTVELAARGSGRLLSASIPMGDNCGSSLQCVLIFVVRIGHRGRGPLREIS